MSALGKRKRGRPRLNESKMIRNIDDNLIKEVKNCPILYDPNHPNYRNRAIANRYWRSIASTLNSTEAIVKSRMIQLRNRYNVEKRRVDTNGGSISSWPLFDELSTIVEFPTKQQKLPIRNTSSDDDDDRNGYVTNDYTQQIPNNRGQHNMPQSSDTNFLDDTEELYNKKFRAFGEFLTSSLIELSEMQALHLVKKFTADLVEYSKLVDVNRLNSKSNPPHSTNGNDFLLD
ncbi:uncharacterized protein LOC142220009 [Haematobia irritans]|uniref:uncharacterized protein LOC142220009 n=1 Tax=Haematobia irritans TaxID=7368 RepID=UPI003F4F56DC